MAACHDAVRKAIDAHCGATGYRIENRPGAHIRAVEYAAEVLALPADDADELDRVRRRRHEAEYGVVPSASFMPAEIGHAANLAERVVALVAALLADGPPGE